MFFIATSTIKMDSMGSLWLGRFIKEALVTSAEMCSACRTDPFGHLDFFFLAHTGILPRVWGICFICKVQNPVGAARTPRSNNKTVLCKYVNNHIKVHCIFISCLICGQLMEGLSPWRTFTLHCLGLMVQKQMNFKSSRWKSDYFFPI